MLDTLLAFLLPIPEFATSLEYSAYTRVAAQAPIKIDACEASLQKVRGVIAHTTLAYGAAFTILGDKPARRVRLRFDFDDTAWHPIGTSEAEVSGTFSPGIKISRTHRYGGDFKEKNRVFKNAAAVVCVPEEVEFADGSVWRDPSKPVLMPSPAPSLLPDTE